MPAYRIEERIADRLCDPKRFLPEVRSARMDLERLINFKLGGRIRLPPGMTDREGDEILSLGLCLEGLEREILGWA